MRNVKLKAIACKISRGGFSDERVFAFEIGDNEYSGVASRIHMWTPAGDPIDDGEPPVGKSMEGLVAARILQALDQDEVLISVPDGGVVKVQSRNLVNRPSSTVHNVPI